MDGAVTRVPFVTDERGSAGALLREQIGCSWYDVIALDGHIDMWVDDEHNADVREDIELRAGSLLDALEQWLGAESLTDVGEQVSR
ncbi:hypothetical protein MTY66_60430 (plasmid) [Mycolicibacterium sp. TY66]|nr:hypothetical protein MTY66_60430 [Mycolicibacterium sp. TY66]BCJ84649.1 hypothetical protein MTY81_60220 [Mycolicibacterium sp. TY81]